MAIFGEGRVRPARKPKPPQTTTQPTGRVVREAEAVQRASSPYDQMSPAARRAIARAEEPVAKQKFTHETDVNNWRSIKQGGIRPSTGGGAMGNEGVYAYEGAHDPNRRVPEGRAIIEFEADPNRIAGRGTTPGNRTRVLAGGSIEPGAITGVYGSAGRLANVMGGTPYHGLYSLLAGMLGLPDIRTPADWIMEQTVGMSDISPYNPKWSETTLA